MRPYQENLILLGDFNSTLGKSTGRTNNRALTELVSGLKLLNTSTLTNTSRNQFTFRSKLGQSCIDHILIGEENRAAVTAFKTLPYAASDHELVMLEINFGSNQTKPRKHKSPYWKFNVSLLDDPDFKEAFTRFYNICRRRKFLYISIGDWWEQDFKRNFKHISSHFAKLKKDDFNKRMKFKEKCLQDMSENLNVGEGDMSEYIELKRTVMEM